MNKKKVLVAGATGYLGNKIVAELNGTSNYSYKINLKGV